jgi:hypothetical protein
VSKGALIAILLLFSPMQGVSTTIVAMRTIDNATIAIDSSFTYISNGRVVSTQHRCKIFRYDRTVFAAAGLATYEGFDVYASARTASRSFDPLDQRIKRFETDIMKRLPPVMERVRSKDVKSFEQLMHAGPVLQTVFATMESGVPALAYETFQMKVRADRGLEFAASGRICPTECDQRDAMFVALGANAAVDKYLKRGGKILNPDEPIPFLLRMMNLEFKDDPIEVSPPVSVLILDRFGLHWGKGASGACPDPLP